MHESTENQLLSRDPTRAYAHQLSTAEMALKGVGQLNRRFVSQNYSSSFPCGIPRFDHRRSSNQDIGTRFGQRLRELRRTQRMTQLDMAVMLGIDRSYLSEVERGRKGISLTTLEIIALGFNLDLSDLLKDV